MSHFYANIQGSRGEATRCGTKNSGLSSHVRGWNVGVKVYIVYNEAEDRDEIHIEATGGSNGGRYTPIGKVIETENGPVVEHYTADD